MPSEGDKSKQIARLLEDERSRYAEGYKAGVAAERARALRLCFSIMGRTGILDDTAQLIAELLSRANDKTPLQIRKPEQTPRELLGLRKKAEQLLRYRKRNRTLASRNAELNRENHELRAENRNLRRMFDIRKSL